MKISTKTITGLELYEKDIISRKPLCSTSFDIIKIMDLSYYELFNTPEYKDALNSFLPCLNDAGIVLFFVGEFFLYKNDF